MALSLFHPHETGGAVFAPGRLWRYALERRWGSGPFVLFVGLNPSTADEERNDPTVTLCMGYARRWGFGGLLVGNAFAYRATNPKWLAEASDPIGPDCDVWLTTMAVRASLIVVAWGAHPIVRKREADVVAALGDAKELHCLQTTAGGHPHHPLYLRRDLVPRPYNPPRT